MKRNWIILAVTLPVLSFCGCTDGTSTSPPATETPQITVLETRNITTEEEIVYRISESEAKSIASDYIKTKYKEYDPVVIGDISIKRSEAHEKYDHQAAYHVKLKGHYWKTDSYGHNAGSEDFDATVYVDGKTGKVIY